MVPRYSCEPFTTFDTDEGGMAIETQFFSDIQNEAHPDTVEFHNTEETQNLVWFCELHMPGYLDRTGWDGPFDSEEEARQHIIDIFDSDPDTGHPLREAC